MITSDQQRQRHGNPPVPSRMSRFHRVSTVAGVLCQDQDDGKTIAAIAPISLAGPCIEPCGELDKGPLRPGSVAALRGTSKFQPTKCPALRQCHQKVCISTAMITRYRVTDEWESAPTLREACEESGCLSSSWDAAGHLALPYRRLSARRPNDRAAPLPRGRLRAS